MTYDEWQAWYDKDEARRGEWVNGEVLLLMPPLISHAELVSFLFRLMGNYVDLFRLGRIFVENAELWLPRSQSARLPDICFISNAHADRLSTHRLEGYADLVVEVISNDSVTRGRDQKFLEYQTAGIPEYWLVDGRPRHRSARVFALDANGRYQALPPDDAGRLRSRVLPGFWIDPAWLWQDPLPAPYLLVAQIVAEQNQS